MPKLTFLDLANKVLTEEKRPLSPSEIWKIAVAKGYVPLLSSEGKTPASTLYGAIFTDARDNPDTIFVKVGARPARYFLKTLAERWQPAELEKAASVEAEVPKYTLTTRVTSIRFSPTSRSSDLRHTRRLFATAPLVEKSSDSGYTRI